MSTVILILPDTRALQLSSYKNSPPSFPLLQQFLITSSSSHCLITGDFNIQVDNPSDSFASEFLTLLSSTNLTQHVNFPTHYQNHTFDLVNTSSLSNLLPKMSLSFVTPSDHYPIFTGLNILPTPCKTFPLQTLFYILHPLLMTS